MIVLIVDDDPDVRNVLRQTIEAHGHIAREARDGEDGLKAARKERIDAIISDGLMPRMDGYQFLRAVRLDGALKFVPFVLYTSVYTGDEDHDLAASLGADELIVKPADPEEVWGKILSAIKAGKSGRAPGTGAVRPEKDEEYIRDYGRIVASKLETKVRELEAVIKEQERTKAVLHESEERYRLLFENNPQPMWVFDRETLAFLAVNDAAIITYGYSREEFLSMTIKDIRPTEDVPALLDKVSRATQGFDAAGIWRHRKKDGTIIDVEITSHSLDFGGRRANLILAIDVTERRRMEKAIRDASDEWRSTFDAMSDAISLLDKDGKILRCNRAMTNLVKKQFHELIGRPCWEVVHGTSGPVFDCLHETMKKSGKREKLVAQLDKRWFEVAADPFFDTEGNLLGAVHIMKDITKRKQAEEILKASEEKYRTLIESANDAIFILDLKGNFIDINTIAYERLGYTKEEMLSKHVSQLDPPEFAARIPERMEQIKKYGKAVFESAHVRKDGSVMPVEINARLIDFEGKKALCSIIRDITGRKQSEAQIYQAKQNWEFTFNSITDMVTVHDKDFNIILANKAAEKILGLPLLEKMKDRKCFSFYHGTNHAPEGCPSCDCLQTGIPAVFELFEPHLNMFIEIRAIPRFDSDNKLIGLIHVVRDITERKRAQDALNERVHQAALGAEIGVALTEGGDLRAVLQQCAEAMVRHLDAAFARIWTLNEKDDVLEMQASAGMYTHLNGPHGRVPVGKFKIGMIAEERRPHMTNEVVGDLRVGDQEWARREGMVAFAGYPLIVQDRLVGVMAMFSRKQLAETTMHSLGSVADIVALGIERKQTEESLARYSKELTELNTASNTLMIITNLTDIYAYICDIIYGVFDLKMVWLGIVGPDTYEVKPVAHSGLEDGYLSSVKVTWDDSLYGKGPTGMAIKIKKSISTSISDPAFAPWSEHARQRGYATSLAVPLIYARDKCIGALNFYSGNPGYFTSDRIKLCEIFANQAAIAIENARLVEWLEEKVQERTKALEDTNIEIQVVNRELELRREEAEAASRSKTDFLANMSHELRTPLNAILGFSEIMEMGMAGPITDKQKEFLGDISTSGKHLLSLITDILDLSKVEAGKVELEPSEFSLREVVDDSLVLFKEKSMKHRIKVLVNIDEKISRMIADKRKIKQILVNLLSNAFKFTQDEGDVRVSARRVQSSEFKVQSEENLNDERNVDFIEISVADTGIGISKDNMLRLFQPFQQVETSLTRKYAGTGLGLSLCRRFVELHGGRIWVESEPGKGSVFTFVIPMRPLNR